MYLDSIIYVFVDDLSSILLFNILLLKNIETMQGMEFKIFTQTNERNIFVRSTPVMISSRIYAANKENSDCFEENYQSYYFLV